MTRFSTPFSKGFALTTAALLVVATACGGDDDTSSEDIGSEVSNAVATVASDASDAVTDASNAVSDGVPAGQATMTYGDTTIDGEVVSCSVTLDPPSAEFTVRADTSEIDVSSAGGLDVDVSVTGAEEFEGQGTIGFADGASLTDAQLSVTGTGNVAGDTATQQDFTMDVTLGSC